MPPNTDDTPLWQSIYDSLAGSIARGELHPGDAIPSDRALARQWGASRDTVRRALDRLVSDGRLTEGRSGAGRPRRVREYKPLWWRLNDFETGARPDNQRSGLDAWQVQVEEQGRQARQEVIDVRMMPAPADVAGWLTSEDGGTLLGPDGLVARRVRRRLADDEPVQLATSYLPATIAAGTMFMDPGNQVVAGGILAHIGHPQVTLEDRVVPRQPTPEEARLLALPRGTAVAEHVRIGKGADGLPVRVMVTIAPGDRNVLVYRIVV